MRDCGSLSLSIDVVQYLEQGRRCALPGRCKEHESRDEAGVGRKVFKRMMTATTEQMIGRVVSQLTRLPEDDLTLVVEFVDYLDHRRQKTQTTDRSPAEIRVLARQRARQLEGVPRSDIVARFRQLADEIKQIAITQGTSFPGDWSGD